MCFFFGVNIEARADSETEDIYDAEDWYDKLSDEELWKETSENEFFSFRLQHELGNLQAEVLDENLGDFSKPMKIAAVLISSDELAFFYYYKGKAYNLKKFKLQHDVSGFMCDFMIKKCKGGWKIDLTNQWGNNSCYQSEVYFCDEKTLKLLKFSTSDSSEDGVKIAISEMKKGNRKLALDELGHVMYPSLYLSPARSYEFLNAARAAVQDHKKSISRKSEILSICFDMICHLYLEKTENRIFKISAPERWFKALKELEIEVPKFVQQLNDLGYFWQKEGKHKEAILIFIEILRIAPERIVTYLNAADSYWALKQKPAAMSLYAIYEELMAKAGKAKKIPARVLKRK